MDALGVLLMAIGCSAILIACILQKLVINRMANGRHRWVMAPMGVFGGIVVVFGIFLVIRELIS